MKCKKCRAETTILFVDDRIRYMCVEPHCAKAWYSERSCTTPKSEVLDYIADILAMTAYLETGRDIDHPSIFQRCNFSNLEQDLRSWAAPHGFTVDFRIAEYKGVLMRYFEFRWPSKMDNDRKNAGLPALISRQYALS